MMPIVFSYRAIWKSAMQPNRRRLALYDSFIIYSAWLLLYRYISFFGCSKKMETCFHLYFHQTAGFQQVVLFIIHVALSTDYSLRNGLLIFFLLVVPIVVLVVLVLLYIFRRESLDPCLKGSLINRLK